MNNLLQIAIQASLHAGKAIMEIYATDDFGIERKSDDSPFTKADRAAHNVIMEHLTPTRIPVLSEEGKDIPYAERKDWKQLWIIDPIDGTREFIKRNGEFTVNIAIVENQIPVLGVIFVPVKNELYFSTQELGAFKASNISDYNNLEDIKEQAQQLPLNFKKDNFTVVARKSHLSQETVEYIKELEQEHGKVTTISKGSSLKLCMVAEGEADEYPRFAPTMQWVTATGQAI